ncbi:uncharacterized protein LOC122869490 isoform X2 [Siniperca chuatsi]|uniref:uncharacterized protein LOC122869490 isoform X2 n=1 Tax=Siniperca chuatsi TaxID=119488 RepID=UPI001CE13291|nr:uncharacterized protein LOC122869490 isoform X2 [Siniperca chuatsi]
METRNPRPSPQGLVSQDDGGLWMDSNPVTDHTESPSVTHGDRLQDETNVTPPAPAVIPRYYSVMDDEGADDVFIPPPPPPYMAPLLPAEGSTDATVNNSSVSPSNGAADATEAKANPSGLDWHHDEKQLMATHEVDEMIASTTHTSKESMDNISLSKDKDSTLPKDQDQTSMEGTGSLMETCYDRSGRHHLDNSTGGEESNGEPEDIVILSGGQENWKEIEAESETHFDKDGDKTKSEDICGLAETDSKLTTGNVGCDGVETNAPKPSSLSVDDDDFESCGPPELCKCNQNKMDAQTNQPQVPEIPTEVSNDDEEHVDTRSLNYNLTKYDWVRRESGASESQVPQLPISEGSEEMVTKGEQGDGSRRIATDIQQGEQLLQRLQKVQLRHDVSIPESPRTSQQVVQDTRGETKGVLKTEVDDLKTRERDLTGDDEKEESRSHTVDDEGAKTNLMEKEKNEKHESKDIDTKAGMSLSLMLVGPEHHMIGRTKARDSDDDQSDSWVPADLSPINPHETSYTQVPFPSSHHRFSSAKTSIERQIHEATQEKQNLQRAGGLFNLADNPDVLEIPFKTNILLQPLTTMVGPGQRSDWQFSEQKMQKEISQEIQRELVLVNQGKIPGGYSKGEVRQLKETKLLFEAFQQDNTEGPTRHRKPPTSLMKGHVYPSVLERTRSLEMFSFKNRRVSRAHSLRLCKSATSEMEKCPEVSRSKSPTGGSRDKTLLYPYPTQDKRVRLYGSMDSLSTDASKSAMETRNKTREGNTTQDSLILEQNPFYKLRPALALQPEVEKDIREAKEREEELRRQRCTLYGENMPNSGDESQFTPTLVPDDRQQSRGKLERVWPPPSKKDQMKSEQTQEPKVHKAGGQKAPLWQRWESGLINGQPPKEKN